MSDDDNKAPESTTDENVEAAAADAVEQTGAGESAAPAADSIEAAADAAAADAPPEPDPETTPEPEPEPEAGKAPAAQDKPKKAGATARKRQTASKRGKDTKANVDHLAAKKASRPEPEKVEAPELTEAELAEVDAKKANRERLREIKATLEEMDTERAALVEEQQVLASPCPTTGRTTSATARS